MKYVLYILICRRFISSGCKLNSPGNYEGEGKTTMNILNSESELGLLINGYSEVQSTIV